MKRTHFFIFIVVIAAFVVHSDFAQTNKPTDPAAENAAMQKAANDGAAAAQRKDYDGAVAIYDAAIKTYPDHPAVMDMLNFKAIVLKTHAAELYNAAVAKKDNAGRESAKAMFRQAADASAKAVAIAETSNVDAETRRTLYRTRCDAMKMLVNANGTFQVGEVLQAYNDLMVLVPPLPAMRMPIHLELAQVLFHAGDNKRAESEFELVLASQPKDPTANFGLGKLLTFIGSEKDGDKVILQNAANHLKIYLDLAPADDPSRADALDMIRFLKDMFKIVPK